MQPGSCNASACVARVPPLLGSQVAQPRARVRAPDARRWLGPAAGARHVPSAMSSRTETLRTLLKTPGIHQGPCCHDALSAKLIEQAGFPFAFMSGFCTAAAKLGAPDAGLITYSEMAEQGRLIHEATSHIPVIGDGDTGYGNAINVKRTVRGYAAAGFAGILIEDQVAPKSCGHVKGKQVVSRDEAVARIRAAVDARDAGADIVIVARTDARQAVDLDEALWRVQAFAEAGADVVFIDALESEDEMRQLTSLRGVASNVPKMASLLEGGGKTPMLSRDALQMLGFKLVAYPLSLLGVSVRAMQRALSDLAADRIPSEDALPSFGELQAVVGFPEYFADAERYAVPEAERAVAPDTESPVTSAPAEATAPSPSPTARGNDKARSATNGAVDAGADDRAEPSGGGVDADEVIEPGGKPLSTPAEDHAEVLTAVLVRTDDAKASRERPFDLNSSAFLRIVITDLKTNTVKLETRLPADWMTAIASTVPQLADMDLEALVSGFRGQTWKRSEPIYETETYGDRVKVYLETV